MAIELRKRRGALGWVLILAASAGCGSNEIERYELSGSVRYGDRLVPAGTISFEPDAQGVGGGFAPIRDGRFDTTDSGRGHLGGKHRVQITGFDGLVNPSNPDSPAKILFPAYDLDIELPKETTTMDFEIPLDQRSKVGQKGK